MTREEAIEILRDTPIDIRSTREDDIHTLYATAQNLAIEALQTDATVGDYPNDLINRNALMEYCSNQKSKTIDNNDIARFPSAYAEPKRVLQGYNKGANTIQTIRHEELTQIANTRKAVESADAVSCEFYEDAVKANIKLVIENRKLKEQIESADAVHGEWQKVEEQPYFRKHYDTVCCSVCRKKGNRKWNYCPSCGARMKGGDSE